MDDPLKGGCCDKKIVKSFNAIIKHFPGLIFHLRIFQGQSVKREDSSVNKYQNLILLLLLIQKLNIFLYNLELIKSANSVHFDDFMFV